MFLMMVSITSSQPYAFTDWMFSTISDVRARRRLISPALFTLSTAPSTKTVLFTHHCMYSVLSILLTCGYVSPTGEVPSSWRARPGRCRAEWELPEHRNCWPGSAPRSDPCTECTAEGWSRWNGPDPDSGTQRTWRWHKDMLIWLLWTGSSHENVKKYLGTCGST